MNRKLAITRNDPSDADILPWVILSSRRAAKVGGGGATADGAELTTLNGSGDQGATQGADMTYDGQATEGDIEAFSQATMMMQPSADLNNDGVVDGQDVTQFITEWNAGSGGEQ